MELLIIAKIQVTTTNLLLMVPLLLSHQAWWCFFLTQSSLWAQISEGKSQRAGLSTVAGNKILCYPLSSQICNRELSNDDGDVNENGKKAIGLDWKTTTLHVHHAFLNISLMSLHDYNVKVLNFTFFRGREQKTTFFSFPEL